MSISAKGSNFPGAIIQGGPGRSVFESGKAVTSTASSWNQGDFIYLDTSAHVLKRVASTANAATIMGMADNVVTSGKLVGPYDGLTATDAAEVGPDFATARYGCVGQPILKTSDAFNPGDLVYLVEGGDSQTVSSTAAGGESVGMYIGPAVASAAAGQRGFVRLGFRYATGKDLQLS